MRSRLNILVAAVVAALVVPQLAMAESVEDQIRLMNERMSQMEDQLQATQDELEASQEQVERQESVIEKAGLEREEQSGLAAFYDQVNISGWLAVSYFYNFNDPDEVATVTQNLNQGFGNGTNQGLSGLFNPFHPDHNSFSVDQLWFEIEKPVTEESRAGFRADLVWGKTAGLLGGYGRNRTSNSGPVGAFNCPNGFINNCEGDSASDFNLYQAYVQYLTPFGPTVKAGKFGTIVGSEVAATPYNYNITRGIVYSLLQPINHYGVLIDGETDGGIVYGVGLVNSTRAIDPDSNNDKSGLFRLGYNADTFGAIASVIYGEERPAFPGAKFEAEQLLFDLVLNWSPNENFSGWINFNWLSMEFDGAPPRKSPDAWGLAIAGRYAFTERLGFALRGEVVKAEGAPFPFGGANLVGSGAPSAGTSFDNRIWSITATADYEVADNLVLKVEGRYDHVSCQNQVGDCDEFVGNNVPGGTGNPANYTRPDQFLGGVELTYSF